MRRITDFLSAGSTGINLKQILQPHFIYHILHHTLTHSASADIAMAHEK
jgi:hypothetical protein